MMDRLTRTLRSERTSLPLPRLTTRWSLIVFPAGTTTKGLSEPLTVVPWKPCTITWLATTLTSTTLAASSPVTVTVPALKTTVTFPAGTTRCSQASARNTRRRERRRRDAGLIYDSRSDIWTSFHGPGWRILAGSTPAPLTNGPSSGNLSGLSVAGGRFMTRIVSEGENGETLALAHASGSGCFYIQKLSDRFFCRPSRISAATPVPRLSRPRRTCSGLILPSGSSCAASWAKCRTRRASSE